MTQPGIALDDIVESRDFSNATMLALAVRLEHSSTFQALIAREIELDELWRRLDTELKTTAEDAAARPTRSIVAAVFDLVWQAHDLAGAEQPLEAAARLRQACALRA
jgi:hypothetical protein